MSVLCSCTKCDKPDLDPSDPNTQTLLVDGVSRSYYLYVPDSYDSTSTVPLMLNFHGYGGVASQYADWADMRPLADRENFILVYPQGSLLGGDPHWNSGLDTPDNKSDANDYGFVEALIDELAANYEIDLERVYACGYSNGSFFSYSLACYLSDKIAAIGSVSGSMMEETRDNCLASHPTPMINLHGTADGVVSYNGGEGLLSVDEVMTFWVEFNNTQSSPVVNSKEDNGLTIEHFAYPNGDNGVSVEHYKVIGGEHVWFDINYEGANTSQLIWDFVKRYDIHGLR